MSDEDICKHMGWQNGFMASLGRDDFAARVRTVVAAAEAAERERCATLVADLLSPPEGKRLAAIIRKA